MRIRIRLYTLMWMWIRILLLIKWCKSAFTSLEILHSSIFSLLASSVSVDVPKLLHFEHFKFLNLDFNADSDPTFFSHADPEPVAKNNADLCGSGSAKWLFYCFRYRTFWYRFLFCWARFFPLLDRIRGTGEPLNEATVHLYPDAGLNTPIITSAISVYARDDSWERC